MITIKMSTSKVVHIATYLIFLALASVSLLVFLNSSISFVVTDLLGIHKNVGNIVGTLGFVDEIFVLISCPLWGVLSDYVAERVVVALGFGLMAAGLLGTVSRGEGYSKWFAVLILSRIVYAIGAAATTTMITALLPAFSVKDELPESEPSTPEIDAPPSTPPPQKKSTSGRLAGFVGLSSGIGALFALSIFLPLPAKLGRGTHSAHGLRVSYWIVAAWAVVSGLACLVGLPRFEKERGIRLELDESEERLLASENAATEEGEQGLSGRLRLGRFDFGTLKSWKLWQAAKLAKEEPNILLAYVGGFVARASSIGNTLFLSLYVASMFTKHGICDRSGREDMKEKCSQAYVLAAKLSGISQFFALIAAPCFGYFCDSEKRRSSKLDPIVISALTGILSFFGIAILNPLYYDGLTIKASFWAYIFVAGMGVSQIGAIVCSLHLLSRGIAEADKRRCAASSTESSILQIKGSISGVYSLCGGLAILLLTKGGGLLADVAPSAPFYLLAGFNVALFIVGSALASRRILLEFRRDRISRVE